MSRSTPARKRAVVAGVRALAGEPVRALATTGFTLEREHAVRRAHVAYLTPRGTRAAVELDPARLRRLDIPVEPAWVRVVYVGPFVEGTIESLELALEPARSPARPLAA